MRLVSFCSHDDFYTIIDLPEGTHEYKFFVDGSWVCDSKEVSCSQLFFEAQTSQFVENSRRVTVSSE